MEEHRLRVFKSMVLRKIFEPERDGDEVMGSGEDYISRSFMRCTPHQYSGDKIKQNKMGRSCGMNGGQERCMQGFGWETQGDHLEDKWEDNIKMDV
jgi:hypothetical protein